MTNYDVFNGDADGICALLQLRLDNQSHNQLVTGVKRDIKLLKKIPQDKSPANLVVLDISLDKNRDELIQLLDQGYHVFYADHHFAGEIPKHDNLTCLIDTDSNICTSLIINNHLQQQHFLWALVGAYGDNLFNSANQLADQHGISEIQKEALKELGTLINYNGYGAQESDLHFAPQQLFLSLLNYVNPLDFVQDSQSDFTTLKNGFAEDINKARNTSFYYQNDIVAVTILPNAQWSRRVSGVYGNELANQTPERAHAILTPLSNQSAYVVSVRAPLNNKTGADELCRRFPTGGGRKAAAGINQLPENQLDSFIEQFTWQYR